ncbi:Apolipophorin-like protein, partial [Euroglyphus maynei]
MITARTFNREKQLEESKLICIKHCHPDDESNVGKFIKFETGKSYVYAVKVTNEILAKINKTQSDETIADNLIQIDGQARLDSINACEVSLQLENVNIRMSSTESSSSAKDEEIELYERQLQIPIIFSYKDGIVTEVCSPEHEQEEPFVINVKKSIISSLQTISHIENDKQDRTVSNNLQESDEFSDMGFLIEESREAHSECEQRIESYRVVESECRSTRSLDTLFNHFDIDLISRVHLQQVSTNENSRKFRKNNSIVSNDQQQWLRDIFRLKKSPTKKSWSSVMEKVELKTVLHDICEDIKQNSNRLSMKTVDYVQQLTQAFRYESAETVKSIWNEQVNVDEQKSFCGDQAKKLKDIFVDTAASLMHENTATIVRDELLRLNEKREQDPMADERLRYLATSMAFAQYPSLVAIQQIVPELLDNIHDSDIVLSISALVKSPAQQHQDYTEFREEMYKKIVNIIMKNVENETAEVQNVRLFIALENVSPQTMVEEQERLLPVIENSKWSDLIRVVAIKSFDAVKPTPKARQSLMKIFANSEESNEIRIISYRTLVKTGSTVEELQQMLNVIEKEQQSPYRHVYNYVCSHQKVSRKTLNNAKHSLLPNDAPEFPEPASLMQVFLSRHYEYDYVDQKTGFGSFFEADVIMPNGNETFKFPRSITVNVTIPMGKTERQMAVAEVTIRQEGFEGSLSEKILSNIKNTLSKHRIDSHQLFGQLDSIVKSISSSNVATSSHRRIQLLINVDGKNIFLYDSDDRENRLSDILKRLQERLPIRVDETMIVMPWQKRIVIDQTSSGVPMYFEINSTYIGSLEAIVDHQNQSTDGKNVFMELMLKPTFVAHTNVGFGIEGRQRMTDQFRIVSQILAAPTIHFQTEIKQAKQLRLKFLLPEQEQVLWKSVTKIIKGQQSQAIRIDDEPTLVTKCTPDLITKFLGVSLCKKTKKASLLTGKQSRMNEMTVDYNEITLRKQTEKMQGIELTFEMPEQFLDPMLMPEDESRMKFEFSIATPIAGQPDPQKRFETEFVVELPVKQSDDQLSANFFIHVFKRKFHAHLELVDGFQQKSFLCEVVNERNLKLVHLNVDGQVQSDESNSLKDAKFNVKAVFQPTEGMKLIDSNGLITYQKHQDDQQKVWIKFDLNEQALVDMVINQNGQYETEPFKISSETKFKIFETQVHHEMLFVKDSKRVKSTNKIRYNRFSNVNQFETFDLEYESNGYDYTLSSLIDNNDEENLKQYLHYKFLSSQYPSLNVDISYNNKQQPDLIDNEFVCKFGKNLESNQFRIERTTRKIHNVHDRESTRLITEIQVQFTPKNIHYGMNAVTDFKKLGEQRKVTTNQVKIEDKKRQLLLIESNFRSEKTLSKPFQSESVAEIKFHPSEFTVSYNEKINEIETGKYHGKIEMATESGSNRLPRWAIKRLQYQYTLESDIDQYEGLVHLIANVRKFHYEAFFENDFLGHCGQMGSFELHDKYLGNFQLKNAMRREGELMYELDLQHHHDDHDNCECKFAFKTGTSLKIDADLKRNVQSNELLGKFLAEKSGYSLTTSVDMNQNGLDVTSVTKKQDQTIFLLHGSLNEQNQLDVRCESKFFILNVQYDHQNKDQNGSTGMLEFQLPQFQIEHESKFQFDGQSKEEKSQSDQLAIFDGQFGGDLHGQIRIEQIQPNLYQLMVDLKAPKQQISHQTKVIWQHHPYSTTFVDCCELLTFDMKNYLGEQMMFDVVYNRNDERNAKKYAHELMISTRLSHAEFSWSPTKALVVMKTKLFNGIDHQTDFEEFNFPLLKFVSKTKHNNHQLIQLMGDLMFKNGQKSTIEAIIGDGHIAHMEFVPMKQFSTQFESRDKIYNGSLEWTRMAPKQWLMKINGKKSSSQFKAIVDHECDDHTDIEFESSTIRGKLQHLLNDHLIKIDLIGEQNEKFDNFEHHSQARWNPGRREFTLTSDTNKSGHKLLSLHSSFVARQSFQMNGESDLTRFPFKLNALININNRHVDFEFHDKLQDKRARFETKAKNIKDFRVQCAWGRPQDETKRIMIESKIQPQQNKAHIQGQWLKHQIECEGELEKLVRMLESPIKIKAQYSNLESNDKKLAKFEHEYNQQEGTHNVLVECRDGQTNLLTGQARLTSRNGRSLEFEMKTETDLKGDWDIMNMQTKYEHRSNKKKNFGQVFSLQMGSKNQKKSIYVKGQSDAKAITYELNFDSPNSTAEKKAKLEWSKPE